MLESAQNLLLLEAPTEVSYDAAIHSIWGNLHKAGIPDDVTEWTEGCKVWLRHYRNAAFHQCIKKRIPQDAVTPGHQDVPARPESHKNSFQGHRHCAFMEG